MENSVEAPQEIKNRTMIRSRNSTFAYPKEVKSVSGRDMHTHIHYSIFSIAKRWISIRDEKMWHIHAMKHCSPLKKVKTGLLRWLSSKESAY